MKQYRFTCTARKELKVIKDYIAAQSLSAAFRFLDEVTQKCNTLAQFPEMGRLWRDLVPPLRSFPVDRYLNFLPPGERRDSGCADLKWLSRLDSDLS